MNSLSKQFPKAFPKGLDRNDVFCWLKQKNQHYCLYYCLLASNNIRSPDKGGGGGGGGQYS